jgi:hypothetical protein
MVKFHYSNMPAFCLFVAHFLLSRKSIGRARWSGGLCDVAMMSELGFVRRRGGANIAGGGQ